MFTDTFEAKTQSWFHQNKYAQVFATHFGWVRAFPMKKSEAHEGLSSLAQRHGVPISIVMDGAKEQVMGEFNRKAQQMGAHVKQTEPYSPWQNAAEGTICKAKCGSGHKQAKKKLTRKLWDHCIKLEANICSHTALDIYELEGQVPETMLSGQTANISPFIQHGWYDWVKFWDRTSFPEPKETFARWLGPSIDVGPAMTSKVLKSNGQVVHSSTVSDNETLRPGDLKEQADFDESIEECLG